MRRTISHPFSYSSRVRGALSEDASEAVSSDDMSGDMVGVVSSDDKRGDKLGWSLDDQAGDRAPVLPVDKTGDKVGVVSSDDKTGDIVGVLPLEVLSLEEGIGDIVGVSSLDIFESPSSEDVIGDISTTSYPDLGSFKGQLLK